jgi:hypothetical protein
LTDYSSIFSSSAGAFNPAAFTGMDLSPAVSYNTASPSKPGFDWAAAGAAASDFMGGVGDLIRGIRGDQPVYRMAGSRLQDYLSSQKQDAYLEQLLKSIIGKNTGLFEDFNPKKSQPIQ